MKYRPLGATGLEVSEIGFGGWGIGGSPDGAVSYGPTDDRESTAALRRAIERGITFFDTADLYGNGHSEALLGATLQGVGDAVVIATKVGLLGPYGPQDFSPRHLRAALEGSLRRLRRDYVDLYQLHNPRVETLGDPEMLETLRGFVKAGVVRALGVSVRTPEDGLAAAETPGIGAIQVNFNMIDQRAVEVGLLDRCRRENVGVICRTPLCFGFLSGKYSAATRFDARDHRSRWSEAQIARWADAPSVFGSALDPAAGTPAQAALRFCLSYPAISTAIPGMLTPEQVDENAAASDLGPLAAEARRVVKRIYGEQVFFLGRASAPPSS